MTVEDAIAAAEALLPGTPAPDGELDFRWRAIIRVGEFVQSEPDAVLRFILRWGSSDDADLRDAVATVLLEHLLEHHFDHVLPQLHERIDTDQVFRQMCRICWSFGDATTPSRRFEWRTLLRDPDA